MPYRLALVTGATSGIGAATCELLAHQGIDLIISGRDKEKLQQLKMRLSSRISVEMILADLAQPMSRATLVSALHAKTPDLVINNAGFGLYGEALTYDTVEQANILEVNAKAVLELTLEAARALISKEKTGVILNVSSAAGLQILPFMSVYAASKAFLNHFSQAFDYEVRRYGIRILTLCPGMVATNFQKRAGSLNSPQCGVMAASFVAKSIWKQVKHLEPFAIIDRRYRFLHFLSHFVPTHWIAAIQERIIKKRILPRHLIKIKS